MVYIRRNPQKHGLVDDFRDWPFSSYHALLSTRPTHVRREDVLAWFGGGSRLKDRHQEEVREEKIRSLLLDDFSE